MHTWEAVLEDLISNKSLIYGVFSDPDRKDADAARIVVRPFLKKEALIYQFEHHRGNQVFHTNLPPEEAFEKLNDLMRSHYRQVQFFGATSDFQVRRSKKGKLAILRRQPSREGAALTHNRTRQYLLPEGEAVPWMVALGIMSPEGKVLKNRFDKFRQINRYLEFIEDCLKHLNSEKEIEIVDFGCGKAYLTFALYDYLVRTKGLRARIVGLDLKTDVIEACGKLAADLGFEGLRFEQGDIAEYSGCRSADMVISLHACDTATDEALARAVEWGAQVILAVPCCHKELIGQIAVDGLEPMLEHGILRERFGSLATDTLRALALEAAGYKTRIMEFIDMEHTPKNLLIRAVRTDDFDSEALGRFRIFKKTIGAEGRLESAFAGLFKTGEK